MAQIGQRKCLNCNEYFDCDPRNLKRQHHCSKPECRRASKAASQAAWLAKPQNQDYFRSPVHVVRVQNWREAHPVYSHPKHKASLPLQDSLPIQTIDLIEESSVCTELPKPKVNLALQDVLPIQPIDPIDESSVCTELPKPKDILALQDVLPIQPIDSIDESSVCTELPKPEVNLALQDVLPIQSFDSIDESSVCTELPKPKDILALQDVLPIQLTDFIDESSVCTETPKPHVCTALQDIFAKPTPVLVGLIAHLFELTLQDDIAETIQRLTQMGYDIINSSHHVNLQSSAVPTATVSGT